MSCTPTAGSARGGGALGDLCLALSTSAPFVRDNPCWEVRYPAGRWVALPISDGSLHTYGRY